MKIGIHNVSGSFSDRWIEYCNIHDIKYKIVDAYASDIVDQLAECNGFLWNWQHSDYQDQLFARQLTLALETGGKLVFPNTNTAWHYDDKLGQKYLLESIGAFYVNSYVFYKKEHALNWARGTNYPIVFKLRGGAGSRNVKLVKDFSFAMKLIKRAFGKGFLLIDRKVFIKEAIWIFRRDGGLKNFLRIIMRMVTLKHSSLNEKYLPLQKGYIFFQEFIPYNSFDDRLVVIGNRCFSIRRYCRTNDFRASGSGIISHDKNIFPIQSVSIAFKVARKLKAQSIAFDFVYTSAHEPLIVEISYTYAMGPAYDNCQGYWDENLVWHDRKVNPQYFIIEDFINELEKRNI